MCSTCMSANVRISRINVFFFLYFAVESQNEFHIVVMCGKDRLFKMCKIHLKTSQIIKTKITLVFLELLKSNK